MTFHWSKVVCIKFIVIISGYYKISEHIAMSRVALFKLREPRVFYRRHRGAGTSPQELWRPLIQRSLTGSCCLHFDRTQSTAAQRQSTQSSDASGFWVFHNLWPCIPRTLMLSGVGNELPYGHVQSLVVHVSELTANDTTACCCKRHLHAVVSVICMML